MISVRPITYITTLCSALVLLAALAWGTPAHAQQSPAELRAMIQDLLAQISELQSQMPDGGNGESFSGENINPDTFTRSLYLGDRGEDVRALQQYLNQDSRTQVRAQGAGSPGKETQYYGPATAEAVAKFQELHRDEVLAPVGLREGTGFFGLSTREHLRTLLQSEPVEPDSYDADDIRRVTTENVDPRPRAIDDEYTLYNITLEDGTQHEVKRFGFAPRSQFLKDLRETGYTGTVDELEELVEDEDSYDADDIRQVTTARAATDEYTLYTITLEDGTQHEVKLFGFSGSVDEARFLDDLRETGYTGTVDELEELVDEDSSSDVHRELTAQASRPVGVGPNFRELIIRYDEKGECAPEFITIDWGDGNEGEIANSDCVTNVTFPASHEYEANGTYTITVTDSAKANKEVTETVRIQASEPDSYDADDIRRVTTENVDPRPRAIDDEYTLYNITLEDGTQHEVKRFGFAPRSQFLDELRETGYTGTVDELEELVEPSSDTDTYRGFMDGDRFIQTKDITRSDALDNCEENAENNPQREVYCTWGGDIIFDNRDDEAETATYRGYFGDGRNFIVTQNVTREYAEENCERNAENNPQREVYCTWGGDEIFRSEPVSTTEPPEENYFSCNRTDSNSSGDGVACYGMWDYGNSFGGDENMCGRYGTGTTVGCEIDAPVCSAGTAEATEYYSNNDLNELTGAQLTQIANNLDTTTGIVQEEIAGLWEYSCTGSSPREGEIMAQIVFNEISTKNNGVHGKKIALGSTDKVVRSGEWFPLTQNGEFIDDNLARPGSMDNLKEFPGLGVTRMGKGYVRVGHIGAQSSQDIETTEAYMRIKNGAIIKGSVEGVSFESHDSYNQRKNTAFDTVVQASGNRIVFQTLASAGYDTVRLQVRSGPTLPRRSVRGAATTDLEAQLIEIERGIQKLLESTR